MACFRGDWNINGYEKALTATALFQSVLVATEFGSGIEDWERFQAARTRKKPHCWFDDQVDRWARGLKHLALR